MPNTDNYKHHDTRVNIPTRELDDFVADDEAAPVTVLYPRDASLDPQLVWKGKDAQDRAALAVPSVPIYIQEKIQPRAIIENVRAEAKVGTEGTLSLFGDFNGLPFEELIDFYHHEQHWSNRMILGDSLLVMTSLAEKERLKGKVQCIYLDPPYGIKFGSNWQVSTRKRDLTDGKAEDATRQPEQVKAFRDTWQLGIHSYLAYLRDRLVVARELLTESGSIFVQIGDENVHLVRNVLDEVFGSENFCQLIPFRKKLMPLGARLLEGMYDYLLWYSKSVEQVKFHHLYKISEAKYTSRWTGVELELETRRKLSKQEVENPSLLPESARIYRLVSQRAPSFSAASVYDFSFQGQVYPPPAGGCWVSTKEKMEKLASAGRLEMEGGNLSYVYYHDDFPMSKLINMWDDTSPVQDKEYVVQTSSGVIERCLLMTTDPGDLVLDPTCGSGTTAYVAEQWGRRWITCDTSRVALALARTRLMAAKYPWYLLADSPEGARKQAEVMGVGRTLLSDQTQNNDGRTGVSDLPDIRKGFVWERVPHVTLKSIANNEEIDVIHARWEATLGPLRARLNAAAGTKWEEWEVPREAKAEWSAEAKALLAQWWEARRARQAEMDASIARRAEYEILYDKPYEDNKRVRVSGPFTVESLSPHRVLGTTDDTDGTDERASREESGVSVSSATSVVSTSSFITTILDNLRAAGVQNTVRNERLKFDRLEPFAGAWIQAAGTYTDKAGISRRAAVAIGPEHGTVGPEQVKEAAKEAMRGAGFDLLVVCGFAFDAHAGETAREFAPAGVTVEEFAVAEETKQYGKLPVMLARMNPDLAMGDEFLKKTGAGNLFMVFGEPDVKLTRLGDGRYTAEVRGVDVYDPTTGVIRSNSTDDIACWFLDTNYNGESFFVRHAYFTGADEPYEKLKRALRAEVNEAAWATLYTTTSRPFAKPTTGKVAVKVINHYGDEVLKVYEV